MCLSVWLAASALGACSFASASQGVFLHVASSVFVAGGASSAPSPSPYIYLCMFCTDALRCRPILSLSLNDSLTYLHTGPVTLSVSLVHVCIMHPCVSCLSCHSEWGRSAYVHLGGWSFV